MIRAFTVQVDDVGHRYALHWEDGTTEHAITLLAHPDAKRGVEHLMSPEVGQHKFNDDRLCPVCRHLAKET